MMARRFRTNVSGCRSPATGLLVPSIRSGRPVLECRIGCPGCRLRTCWAHALCRIDRFGGLGVLFRIAMQFHLPFVRRLVPNEIDVLGFACLNRVGDGFRAAALWARGGRSRPAISRSAQAAAMVSSDRIRLFGRIEMSCITSSPITVAIRAFRDSRRFPERVEPTVGIAIPDRLPATAASTVLRLSVPAARASRHAPAPFDAALSAPLREWQTRPFHASQASLSSAGSPRLMSPKHPVGAGPTVESS